MDQLEEKKEIVCSICGHEYVDWMNFYSVGEKMCCEMCLIISVECYNEVKQTPAKCCMCGYEKPSVKKVKDEDIDKTLSETRYKIFSIAGAPYCEVCLALSTRAFFERELNVKLPKPNLTFH